MGPLVFLTYINDWSEDLKSNLKFFTDDGSLFSAVKYVNLIQKSINRDLVEIKNWAHQGKTSFNPDP